MSRGAALPDKRRKTEMLQVCVIMYECVCVSNRERRRSMEVVTVTKGSAAGGENGHHHRMSLRSGETAIWRRQRAMLWAASRSDFTTPTDTTESLFDSRKSRRSVKM